MKIIRIILFILLFFTLSVISVTVAAQCPNTSVVRDNDLWAIHNCWQEFEDWFVPYFNLREIDWNEGWGWNSCDPSLAFPKMFNSAFLLTYGLDDSELGPWHSNIDYYSWASGSEHDFRYEPEDSNNANATAFAGFWQTNRVEMKCPILNNHGPAVRAGTMLHEATHIIYWRWKHQPNLPHSNCTDDCSDDWFYHELGDIPYGELDKNDIHSMNQIKIEYLCDLHEFHQSWLPNRVYLSASLEANSLMTNRILNPPGWSCGLPRPISIPLEPEKINDWLPALYEYFLDN